MSHASGSIVERFTSALADLDVPVTRTTPTDCAATIAGIVAEPVVGVELPFEGVTLPGVVDTDPSPSSLEAARTGVTPASFGIADYGSVALTATPDGSEPVSLFVDRHVAVLRRRDLLPDMPTAFERLGPALRAGDSVVLATGPSATADMGELVRGAHGPKEVHVVLVDDEGATDE
ncbi:hypothetical protein GRS48_00990 [Halorubrum sp. JWXQ-INN 858]|uniref:LutC/YkgG family protein n=1 Tax=Halorubrum sp. JWXQ-INN 858 TaxID=2690782 RepID=UPI0013579F63|nr:LUD domain-containing protein [Halorubrum sp. JWXQ-INN 858]MWV63410.1 hypothetical protein [Halorubrum sp. JWXQ-INN 858]